MSWEKRHRRRGGIYILVLGSAMIVMVIGLSALLAIRVERRTAQGSSDLAQARLNAQSAIEIALLEISQDANWRTTYTSGPWLTDQPIGNGTFSLMGTDPNDNDLTNDPMNPLLLTGIGFQGQARYRLSVSLTARVRGLSCLEAALSAGGSIGFDTTSLQCDQTISANGSVNEVGSTIDGDVEAVGAVTGTGYTGTTTSGIAPRALPNGTAFDYYINAGTPIARSSLPTFQEDGISREYISKVVISPTSNPFGAQTNPEGIYVIDCQGSSIVIEDSRIVGTLVFLNTANSMKIQRAVSWEPAVANYPILLVDGDMSFQFSQGQLDEGNVQGDTVNFNPPGTPYPYPGGTVNSDTADTYPSLLTGLIYISGDVLFKASNPTVSGAIVAGGQVYFDNSLSSLSLTYKATYLNNPPPGFAEEPTMVITPGSWKPVVD